MPETGLQDHDIIGEVEKSTTERREVVHHEQLTPEEMVVAKKLRTKIDIRIMPLVILVYLMNYIDRYVTVS